ncbi:MAG: leucine--tRNA ligase [Candidatus Hatepunaea meridiana]|nr:leucine--tRNA ligase [Candidatus Hatepunaea meridiana]
MDSYPFNKIEPKWRKYWEDNHIYESHLDDMSKKKMYVLVMFSYPSEKKIHIGHLWNYGGVDTFSRFKRMQGYNVFEPMGFDAFGLPAENFAIKHGVHPAVTTHNSINSIREQLKQIGAMYDWDREVDTSKPEYYKWTQWLFLQLFKTGAAYRKQAPVNWCPQCQTVLANEQVDADGSCERCGSKVNTRDLEQWFFRITDFADQLLEGLDELDWPEATKSMQRHWIGRSEGTEIDFQLEDSNKKINCFTTRADTLFGVTYIVLAPEHNLVKIITTSEQRKAVEDYITTARRFSDIERLAADRIKTGVFTGAYAVNPANGRRLPVWIADYVLASYGTGAVMAVPAHDQRDFEFTQKYDLPVKWVIEPVNSEEAIYKSQAYETYGVMHNSDQFDGLTSEAGKETVTNWLEEREMGKAAVSYRLRDWLISRQRYWGAPIPIIHCPKCGLIPIPEEDLPVYLPQENVDFTPHGSSPLGSSVEFIETTCPECGEPAKRDPDTMDTFVCSSWYYLRYISTEFNDQAFDRERVDRWLPIDVYIGGPEHATGHLIYARYISRYLNSIGAINCKEPFKKLIHQGIITYNGSRMSKSKGNVVNPDEFVEEYGSDCFRLYLMFMGDFRTGGDWSDEGIVGIKRFQNRVWRLVCAWDRKVKTVSDKTYDVEPELRRLLHYTIKEVTNDLDRFEFNTAISRLMELVNELYRYTSEPEKVDIVFMKVVLNTLALLLGPLAPHLSEELWQRLGNEGSLFNHEWPKWDETAITQDVVTVVIQVNGKLSDRLLVSKGTTKEVITEIALTSDKVKRRIGGKQIKKVVFIPDKVISFVVK